MKLRIFNKSFQILEDSEKENKLSFTNASFGCIKAESKKKSRVIIIKLL